MRTFRADRDGDLMIVEDSDTTDAVDGQEVDGSRGIDRMPRETADRSRRDHMIDEWGQQSFPASDPPPTW
jgi:hypothetical protein